MIVFKPYNTLDCSVLNKLWFKRARATIAEAQHLQVVAISNNIFNKSFSQMCDTRVSQIVMGLAVKLPKAAPEEAWEQFP